MTTGRATDKKETIGRPTARSLNPKPIRFESSGERWELAAQAASIIHHFIHLLLEHKKLSILSQTNEPFLGSFLSFLHLLSSQFID